MHETQLEQDFVAWLGELSACLEIKSQYWLETKDGDANGGDFCGDCVEIKRIENERNESVTPENRYVCVHSDGGSAMEQDSQPFCERCGAVLLCSPTEYMIENEIEWLEKTQGMDATDAASFSLWMSGIGGYDRDKNWPKIEPHARRLMAAAGVDVVQPGFVRFRPSESLLKDSDRDARWMLAWEYYARKLVEWNKEGKFREFLNNTSSINNWGFSPITRYEDFRKRLKNLFRYVKSDWGRKEFLAFVGIKEWADLDKPILIADNRPPYMPEIFKIGGRLLKRPGPNEFHPNALTVYGGVLRFSDDDFRWTYAINYSYPDDRSSWTIDLEQADDQLLPEFFAAIGLFIEDVCEPETEWDARRRMDDWKEKVCL